MSRDPRVLTLTQPWASLVAAGAKRVETRRWRTRWRGRLVIRSAATFPRETPRDFCAALCLHSEFARALRGRRLDDLPLGAAVCVTSLRDIVPTVPTPHWVIHDEGKFGDFSEGRFAWLLADMIALPEPIVCAGGQGIRRVSEELRAALGLYLT